MPELLPGPLPEIDTGEMSLIDHLDELRTRILKVLAVLAVTFILGFFISDPVIETLIWPIRHTAREPGRSTRLEITVQPDGTMRVPSDSRPDPTMLQRMGFTMIWPENPEKNQPAMRVDFGSAPQQNLYYSSPIDPFMLKIKVGFLIALAITAPMIVFQIWGFVKPGLTAKERKLVKPMLMASLVLFPIGAFFAYVMVTFLLKFMQHYVPQGLEPMLSIFQFLSLLTTMMLACGALFELPLALAIAARVGLITPAMMTEYRKHIYVGLTVLASIVAPPDAYSMLIMLAVLVALYEVSVAICKPMAAMHERDQREAEIMMSEDSVNAG